MEAGGKRGRAAQLVVGGEHQSEASQPLEDVREEVRQRTAPDVQNAQCGQRLKAVLGQAIQAGGGQVERLQLGEDGEDADVQVPQRDSRQVQKEQGGQDQRGSGEETRERIACQQQQSQVGHVDQVAVVEDAESVVPEVQAVQVGEEQEAQRLQTAAGQPQVRQPHVLFKVARSHAAARGIHVAQLWKRRPAEGAWTDKGQTQARAAVGARDAAETLVVELRALRPAVARAGRMQAHRGAPAAEETRTRVAVAVRLVLTARAVVDPVTPQKHGQAETATRTLEVCGWTR